MRAQIHIFTSSFTVPNPPVSVAVTPSVNNEAEVTFVPPAVGAYDGFRIRVNGDIMETLGADATSATIGGLQPNVLYTFAVTSFVGIGGDEAESTPGTAQLSIGILKVMFLFRLHNDNPISYIAIFPY